LENVVTRKRICSKGDGLLIPRMENREAMDETSSAGMQACWTCGSCDFECPVNIYTHALRPQKIVRMANLGLWDELLQLPEIWYCIGCRRCGHICPNVVKPWALIEYARRAAIFKKYVSWESVQHMQRLWMHFQKIRWHAVAVCIEGGEIETLLDGQVEEWLNQEDYRSDAVIRQGVGQPYPDTLKLLNKSCSTTHCYTCSECSSVCPISGNKRLFDPSGIVRMVNLGMVTELLNTPAIWLCLGCRRCSDCCCQGVDGANLIQDLRDLALSSGAVDFELKIRMENSFRVVCQYFLREINLILFPSVERAGGLQRQSV